MVIVLGSKPSPTCNSLVVCSSRRAPWSPRLSHMLVRKSVESKLFCTARAPLLAGRQQRRAGWQQLQRAGAGRHGWHLLFRAAMHSPSRSGVWWHAPARRRMRRAAPSARGDGGQRRLELAQQLAHRACMARRVLAVARPLADLCEQRGLAQVEMGVDRLLELRRRALDLLDHRVADRRLAQRLIVLAALQVALGRVAYALVARLVEEGVGHEDEGLDRHEHLQQRRRLRVPRLARVTLPRAQQREADLAILVEVRVDALAVGDVMDGGRLLRELGRQLKVEGEDGVLVRRAGRADDEGAQQVDSLGERTAVDPLGQACLQQLPLLLRDTAKGGPIHGRRRRRAAR
mmetsp:Transcript_59137/g.155616  ORF Transcript_59137/g.155616 Transcript_59137/m.155616 type:complete len:346 (+) Transcript_59137:65-1102(+)